MSHVHVEDLLSSPCTGPTEEGETFEKAHTRSNCSYQALCDKFKLEQHQHNYVTQYAHIYFSRLSSMSPYLKAAALKKWGKSKSLVYIGNYNKNLHTAEIGFLMMRESL